MPKKVLITGVGGFIGKHLAKELVKQGFEVNGIDLVDPEIAGLSFNKINILNKKEIQETIKDKDIIIHLAALTAHEDIVENPYKTLELNLLGVYNVLHAFENSSAKQFIFPSTGKVYGKPEYLPYDEKHPTNPETILGKSKLISEKLIDFFAMNSKKDFVIFRIFNVYGPMQKSNFLMPTIINQLNKEKMVLGDIRCKRDYIYISDVVGAFITLIKNPQPGLNIYNISAGKAYSAEEIVRELERIINKKLEIIVDKSRFRKGEFDEELADTAKLRGLGWQPKTTLSEGLRRVLG